MNALTLEQLRLRRGDEVLEVGFGGGALLASILAAGAGRVVGIERSEAMIARSGARLGAEVAAGRLILARASVEALPLADASVDRLCSVNSVYFWPDAAAAMTELARVARPGARLVLCLEPPEELRKWPGHEYGFRLWRGDEVAQMMRDAGFGRIEAEWRTGRKPDLFLCLSGTRLGANGIG